MALGERARTALMFALAVAAAQTACLLAIWMLGLFPPVHPGRKRAGIPGLFRLASFVLLLAVPMLLHDGPVARRWPPTASRQATIAASVIGLGLGSVAGGLLVPVGLVVSPTLAAAAGAVVGSFVALFLLNLLSSGS
jgi:hypothetical protein